MRREAQTADRSTAPSRATEPSAVRATEPRLVALQRSAGNAAVTAMVQRSGEGATAPPIVAAPTPAVLPFEALLEQMAHGYTYDDRAMNPAETALLEANGYRASP